MKNRKEILEAEINYNETSLIWRGIPAFQFLSGLAALFWLLVLDQVNLSSLKYTMVLAVFIEKIIWSWLNYNEIENLKTKEIFKVFNVLKEDILKDLWLEISRVIACLYLVWNWEISSPILLTYFIINLIIVLTIFIINDSEKTNNKEINIGVESVKNRWVTRIVFLFCTLLDLFMTKIVYELATEKNILDHTQLKTLVLLVGISLLVRFYQKGKSILTILLFKKNQLIEHLKEH